MKKRAPRRVPKKKRCRIKVTEEVMKIAEGAERLPKSAIVTVKMGPQHLEPG